MVDLRKKEIVYYARIFPNVGIYDVCELSIRTITETYFVGIDKRDKHAYLFNNNSLNKTVFKNRQIALNKVLEAEKNKTKVSEETYYEEY